MNICKRCDHQWFSRTKNPKACPRCKSYKWKAKKVITRTRIIDKKPLIKIVHAEKGFLSKQAKKVKE